MRLSTTNTTTEEKDTLMIDLTFEPRSYLEHKGYKRALVILPCCAGKDITVFNNDGRKIKDNYHDYCRLRATRLCHSIAMSRCSVLTQLDERDKVIRKVFLILIAEF